MAHDLLLNEIALCIVVAWGLAVLAKLLRTPLIVAYLGAGVLLGPIGLGWIKSEESISTLSELGLIFLLFMIGLEIDLKKIASAGKAIIVTAFVQVLGGFLLGLGFFILIGFALNDGKLDALYLAVAAALSSTVIIVKILYDKFELYTLAGRITLGVLVLQDLLAVLFLAIQGDLTNPGVGPVLLSFVKVATLVAVSLVTSRFVLPPLFRAVARLPELVLVGALAWCFLICGLATYLGLSREMGALIAGVAISTFPYTLDVIGRVTTLRDFFLTLFFVGLGMTIPSPDQDLIGGALAFSAFVIISRVLTVLLPLHAMKLGHRTSFLPALNLAQVSEFSLVIIALGLKAQHLDARTSGVVAYGFVLLAINSSYMLMKSDDVLRVVSPWLSKFGLADLDKTTHSGSEEGGHEAKRIYILGCCWTASSLLQEMALSHPALLKETAVIDFNPQVNQELRQRGITVIYGDVSQRETLVHAGIDKAEVIVSSIPDFLLKNTSNLRLTQQLREINPKAAIIVHADWLKDVPGLYAAGASYVSVPRILEAKVLCDAVIAAGEGRLQKKRLELDRDLADRREVIM